MKKKYLITKYFFFSVAATLINIFSQRIILSISETNLYLFLAISTGTFLGLIVKYFLDKKWIFFDKVSGIRLGGKQFFKYTSMGIFSTLIFWAIEFLFWFIWGTHFMREVGALIGLLIGYITKYNLDKRFVFTTKVS